MLKKEIKVGFLLPYFVISLIAIATRLPLIEKFQSHWDGPDYSIAVIRYSLSEHTPTPPGYPLYIALGKFFHIFVNDPHLSMLLVSVLASVIGALAFYGFGKQIYNKYVGLGATTIFLTCSTFYYLSLTPYGYELIASIEVLLALIVYRIFILRKQDGILLGLLVAICFGIRPQEMLLIGPLAILGFVFLDRKNKIYAILIFIGVTIAWLLPLVKISGGIQRYIAINRAVINPPGFTHSFSYNLPLAIKGLLLTTGISLIFLAYYPYKFIFKRSKINKLPIIFYLTWIIPGLFFNLFIRGEHAGYQVSYLTAIIILIAYSMWAIYKKRLELFYFSLVLVAVFNLAWFFYDRDPNYTKPFRPTSFHYSDIRKNDLIIGSKVDYVRKNFDPKDTLILSTEVAWRPYNYYLKSYPIIALYALDNKGIPYIYNKIVGKGWDMERTEEKNFSLKIPENISSIILMDTQMNNWLMNSNYKVVSLPGKSNITIIPIKKNSSILYNYHKIKVTN